METIGDRIKQFAKEKFKTVTALEKAMGVGGSSLHNYITNRSKPGSAIQEKLRAVGCDIEWLMTGKKAVEPERSPWSGLGLTIIGIRDAPKDLKIPVMLNPASCGDPGMETTDEIAFYFEPGKVYDSENTLMVEAKGDSMTGVLDIHEGDWLVVDFNRLPHNGCVVLARVNDSAVIKRLRKNGQDILLTPDNPAYNPIVADNKNVKILGIITEIKRML